MAYLLTLFLVLPIVDLGVHGKIYPIEEENLIDYIQHRIEKLDDTNLLAFHQKQRNTLRSPRSVAGLHPAASHEIHYFDPTVVLKRDIEDDKGNVVIPKGTRYNPLDYFFLSQDLLFFDGEDPDHLEWAQNLGSDTKWILVRGNPLELEAETQRAVFFDQHGLLCKKLSIESIPCSVSQSDKHLKIESFPLSEVTCAP